MNSVKDLFNNIRTFVLADIPTARIYLYGESLREILLNRKPFVFEFFIETKETEKIEKLSPRFCLFKNTKFVTGKKINTDKEIITVNCLYLDITEGNISEENVDSFNNGLRDFNKGVIKLTEKAKVSFDEFPFMAFTILNTLDTTDYYIDPNTAFFLFNKREVFHTIEKRRIFNFLRDILKRNHPRKFIAYLNTFGISKELFGVNLVESPVVNHLKSNDIYELFSVIFDNIDVNNLEMFLIEKCGFLLKDVENVMKVTKIIRSIDDESDAQLEEILSKVDKNRAISMCRLLKAMNFKILARNLRKQKSRLAIKTDLCINESALRVAFGIENEAEIKKLLDLALAKITANPEFNDKSKILLYLNSERTKACQDLDQQF
jgi:tRNA nucleotidyltransferase/poly(A) polymerase